MPFIDHLLGNQVVRKAIWRLWYPFLTRRLERDGVVFLNYAYESEPPMAIPLSADDEVDRACIQLYHHVGAQAEMAGKLVLEVSCGHGGGASYLTRTFHPQSYTGLDLNPAGVAFCSRRHQVAGLNFIQGDACNLPCADESFDVIVNVEASHCYPELAKFLSEVKRVLKPGGAFLYADFRFQDGIAGWLDAVAECGLEVVASDDIGPSVIRGMEVNSPRSVALIESKLPKWMHGLGRDFAGVKGSRIYNALVAGEVSYRSWHLVKR